jgi:hypothetical protein
MVVVAIEGEKAACVVDDISAALLNTYGWAEHVDFLTELVASVRASVP